MLRPTLVDTRPDSTPEPTLRLAQETVLTGRFGERPFPVHRGTRQLRKQQTFLDAGIDLNEVRTPKQTVQPDATTGPDCVFSDSLSGVCVENRAERECGISNAD